MGRWLTRDLLTSTEQTNKAKLFLRTANFSYLTRAKKTDLFWKVSLKFTSLLFLGLELIWFELWQCDLNTVNKYQRRPLLSRLRDGSTLRARCANARPVPGRSPRRPGVFRWALCESQAARRQSHSHCPAAQRSKNESSQPSGRRITVPLREFKISPTVHGRAAPNTPDPSYLS